MDIKKNRSAINTEKAKLIEERFSKTLWLSQNFINQNFEFLGEGTYGMVFGVIWKASMSQTALKYIKSQNEEEYIVTEKEIRLLVELQKSGHVIKMLDYHCNRKSLEIFILMERGDSNLREFIEANNNSLSLDLVLQIFSDLVCGLNYAHVQKIVHSDLKPANVLVFHKVVRTQFTNLQSIFVHDQGIIFKITDWGGGCANVTGKTTKFKTDIAFSVPYAAPEVLRNEEHLNLVQADIYSLGMTMLICCGVPFDDIKHISSISKKKKHDTEIAEVMEIVKKKYNSKMGDILLQMLQFDRHQRISLAKIMELMPKIKNPDFKKDDCNSKKNGRDLKKTNKQLICKAFLVSAIILVIFQISHFIWKNIEEGYRGFENFSWQSSGKYEGENKNDGRNGKWKYFYDDGRIYDGDWKNDRKEGLGTLSWPNGDKYEGEFKNDKQNGKGKHFYADGRIYEGDWKDGFKEGVGKLIWPNNDIHRYGKQYGQKTFVYSNGKIYEGDWKHDLKEGFGKLIWPNGDKSEGEFKNDEQNGKGKYFYADGRIYEGDWKGGLKEGFGKVSWPNGDKFEGEFKINLANGKGKYVYADGRIYEGDWKHDKKEGFGKLSWPKGDKYEGEFRNGQEHGKGKYFYDDGRIYEGDWRYGLKEGVGKLIWPNGDKYEGGIKNGKQYGKGKYFYNDGRIYEGDWYNGLKDGFGKLIWPNGDQYEGEFRNDERNVKGKYFYADGRIYQGDWKGGLKEGFGRVSWLNGDRFEGQFKNDKRNGKGKYFSKGGRIYVGIWEEGKQKETTIWEDGKQQELTIFEKLKKLLGFNNDLQEV